MVWAISKTTNLWIAQDWGSKYACLELTMTTSTKGANVIFGEHNVNLSTKGIEHGWKKHM